MLGTGLNFGRARGENRFYVPGKHRRSFNGVESDRLRRAHSDVTESRSSSSTSVDSVSSREPENRVWSDEAKKGVAVPSCEGVEKRLSNLEQFLQSITPSVPAQYLSKRTMRGFKACDVESQPYFVLGDLWESFREWSAYGAGVPLVLNGNDSVVQYYVPYLSGIQIYAQSPKPSVKSRILGEDSDSDFRDSSSDGSSDCEPVRGLKYSREQRNLPHVLDDVPYQISRLSLRDHHTLPQDGFSSDDGESSNSQGYLLFEYLEPNPPYSREPLADKILDLAFRLPELLTLRSCHILPSSWISVAWYPIYRIPTGPTLKDLDACFLTYHFLCTPVGGAQGVQPPVLSYSTEMDRDPKMSLPVFGLVSYKFKGSLWTPNGGHERQLAFSLSQAADNWLRQLQAKVVPDEYDERTYCVYTTDASTVYGLAAFGLLLLSHAVLTAVTRCLCCGKGLVSGCTATCATLLFIFSWISFLGAEACLLAGSARNAYHTKYRGVFQAEQLSCATLRKGVFAAGAGLTLVSMLASILYYWAHSKADTGGWEKHCNEGVGLATHHHHQGPDFDKA